MSDLDPTIKRTLAASVAQICKDEGIESINISSIEILTRLAIKQMEEVTEKAANSTRSSGRIITNTSDMSLALLSFGVTPQQLTTFLENHPNSTPIPDAQITHVPTTFPDEDNNPPTALESLTPFPPHIPPYLPPLPPERSSYATLISQDQTQLNKKARR